MFANERLNGSRARWEGGGERLGGAEGGETTVRIYYDSRQKSTFNKREKCTGQKIKFKQEQDSGLASQR